jgi:hypothetical protein
MKIKITQCLIDDGNADLTITTSNGKNVFDILLGEFSSKIDIDIEIVVLLVTRRLQNTSINHRRSENNI